MTTETEHMRDVRADARTLPRLNPAVVDALQDMLMSDSGSTKPPEQAARLLALLYELDKEKLPAPTREVMAQALGGSKSKWTVDAIVSSKLNEGYLTLAIEIMEGNVKARSSTRKERYLIPSRRVLSVARSVDKKPTDKK